MIRVNDFHGHSERAVKQELYAHFVLITMSQLCASVSEHLLASLLNFGEDEPATEEHLETEPAVQESFKNTITVFARRLEEMLCVPWGYINQIITEVISGISRFYHKKRGGRHFPRESRQPAGKWSSRRSSA